MFICLNTAPELLSQPSLEKQVFLFSTFILPFQHAALGVCCGLDLAPVCGVCDAKLPLNSQACAQLRVDPVGSVGRQGEGGTDSSLPPCPRSHL